MHPFLKKTKNNNVLCCLKTWIENSVYSLLFLSSKSNIISLTWFRMILAFKIKFNFYINRSLALLDNRCSAKLLTALWTVALNLTSIIPSNKFSSLGFHFHLGLYSSEIFWYLLLVIHQMQREPFGPVPLISFLSVYLFKLGAREHSIVLVLWAGTADVTSYKYF